MSSGGSESATKVQLHAVLKIGLAEESEAQAPGDERSGVRRTIQAVSPFPA